jgi:hypothetical protein
MPWGLKTFELYNKNIKRKSKSLETVPLIAKIIIQILKSNFVNHCAK